MNVENPRSLKWIAVCFAVVLFAGTATAQMPHRVAVLVNENSQASKKAANIFSRLHGVPSGNLIYLDLPDSIVTARAECSPEEFTTLIYEPAQKIIQERGLAEQVVAWVYSVDFPIRVVTSPNDRQQMSIMGMTFLRGETPDLSLMEKGQIISPLFAGPGPGNAKKTPSRSFSIYHAGLKDKMPLPSMMLGYIGENGNDMDTVIRCLEDGVRARESSKPLFLLVKTGDANRSTPREWQFDSTKLEVAARGGAMVITTNQAPKQLDLMGVMTGAEKIKPADYGTFAPGAMAEHLTSWSAEFQKPQSKCTDWLAAGATVTAGMVTEPYNNWVKFPHARFFAHYTAGCSALESFYQSIASPVQVLLLGDPLARIAALPVKLKAIGLSKEISSDLDAAFVAEATFSVPATPIYSALLNGRQIKHAEANALIELPFDEMDDGYHEVRLLAQVATPVTPGGFQDIPVLINKKGRSTEITGLSDELPEKISIQVSAKGGESPTEIYLFWNGLELDRKPYVNGTELVVDERTLGEGPHRVQAVTVYEDGMKVRSAPKLFAIEFNSKN
ncbi:MAG: TIGR03790 family protein [Kiritimatiellaceae bacterium]|nr:TIGR03790 family protein [Kiritimatiellaceae bacterium]